MRFGSPSVLRFMIRLYSSMYFCFSCWKVDTSGTASSEGISTAKSSSSGSSVAIPGSSCPAERTRSRFSMKLGRDAPPWFPGPVDPGFFFLPSTPISTTTSVRTIYTMLLISTFIFQCKSYNNSCVKQLKLQKIANFCTFDVKWNIPFKLLLLQSCCCF